ncbi:MAG: SHD1 domain-containing protein [Planctomycetaceae bacterium]|nr:SHD1 domain-containing protein [Planctomycetaceae bacterium]
MIAAWTAPVLAAEMRTWTDRTGQFTVEAEFVRWDNGNVHLRKTNGKEITLPMLQLAPEDLGYVMNLLQTQLSPSDMAKVINSLHAQMSQLRSGTGTNRPKPGTAPTKTTITSAKSPPVAAKEKRTWTDSTGQFNVEAELVRVDGENVLLRTTNGKQLTIPLAKLSNADRKYVTGHDVTTDIATSRVTISEAGLPEPVQVSPGFGLGELKQETQWDCPPDPCPAEKLDGNVRPLTFVTGKFPFGVSEDKSSIFFNGNGSRVAFGMNVSQPDKTTNFTKHSRVWIGDMATGRTVDTAFGEKLTLLGISPGGQKVALQSGDWESRNDEGARQHLYIGDVTGSGIVINKAFTPFDRFASRNDKKGDIMWADWVSDDLILVQSDSGLNEYPLLLLLDVNQGRTVWEQRLSAKSTVCLSPGRRYAIIVSDFAIPKSKKSGAFLLLAATGEGIGRLDGVEPSTISDFAFSPDGKTIASCTFDSVMFWNATTGQKQGAFYVGGGKPLQWYDNRYLLASRRLIDTQTQSVVWDYNYDRTARAFGGKFWYTASLGNDIKVLSVTLPHPKAIETIKNNPSIFCVAPGKSVALVLDGSIQNGRAEIQKYMEDVFRENGWKLANNAPVTVMLKATVEPEETAAYIGRGSGLVTVTFRPRKFMVEIQADNKTVWAQHARVAPILIEHQANMSVQEAVNKWIADADYKEWLLSVKFPKSITDPNKIGFSRLTGSGIEEWDSQK